MSARLAIHDCCDGSSCLYSWCVCRIETCSDTRVEMRLLRCEQLRARAGMSCGTDLITIVPLWVSAVALQTHLSQTTCMKNTIL